MKEQKDRYEIFLKVCETGSFSKAAEALNYTQSGISQMMAGLEEELGVQLFARVKRGVSLTDNGARLIPYIQEMVNQKDKLRQAAFNINNKIEGKLRVGSFSSITALWMPDVVHFFRENYPKVDVEIFDGNYDEIRDWIIHGQVDCGFLSSIVADDLTFYPLLNDPLCAVFPEGHPLAAKNSVTLPELFEYPLIIETPGCDNDIQHLLTKCPVRPKISYSFRDDTLIMSFVRNGLGVTISQELVLKAFARGVVSRPLSPSCHRTLGLAFSKTANSVVSQTMLRYLQETIHPSSTILLFYIMIASAIRAASGISCCRLIGSTAVRTLHGGHAKLGRIHGLIVHQFLLSRQNLIPDGIRIPTVFSLIFVNIHGHTDGIGRSALFKRSGNHCLPLDLILVKIMHDHIHRESAVYHIRRILHVTVDLGGISDSVFYDE